MNKHIKPRKADKSSAIQIILPTKKSTMPVPRADDEKKRLRSYADIIKSLRNCSRAMETIEGEYRNRLNSILADLYGYARDISENKDWWSAFCGDPSWQGKAPSTKNSKSALRYVIKWACASNRESQKSASLYYRALMGFWSRKVSRDKIASEIARNGGLRKLADRNAKARKPVKEKNIDAIPAAVRSPSISDVPREEPMEGKKLTAGHTLLATFVGGFEEWKRLKRGARVSMEMTLDEMGGRAAQITVHEVTVR